MNLFATLDVTHTRHLSFLFSSYTPFHINIVPGPRFSNVKCNGNDVIKMMMCLRCGKQNVQQSKILLTVEVLRFRVFK